MPRQPFDTFVWAMALFGAAWTIFCHAMVFSGADFHTLSAYAPLTLLSLLPVGVMLATQPPRLTLPALPRYAWKHRYVLLATAIVFAVVLFVSRWDGDEVFYASIPVFTLGHPDLPLLCCDTIHGYPEKMGFLLPIYRLHCFELLSAWLASVTGIDSVFLLHIILPVFYAALFLIAWYRLFDYFLPEKKQLGLLMVVAFSLLLGETATGPGNNTLVKFYQGKNALAFALMPLLFHCSLHFLTRPDWRNWLLMSLLCIFGLGLSSSAFFLMLIPLGALSLVLWRPTVRQTLICGLNVLSGWYLLAVGFYMKGRTAPVIHGFPDFDELMSIETLWPYIFGYLQGSMIALALLLLWLMRPEPPRHRILRWYVLIVLCIMSVPPLARFFADHLVSTTTFWRLGWLVPVYLILPLVFFRLLEIRRRNRFWDGMATFFFTICITVLLGAPVLRSQNMIYLGWPGPKADPHRYSVAAYVQQHTPPDTLALAEDYVALYLPWMKDSPRLIFARAFYFPVIGFPFGEEETLVRARLQRQMNGWDGSYDPGFVRHWISALNVGSVTFPVSLSYRDALAADLIDIGFARSYADKGYEVFICRNK